MTLKDFLYKSININLKTNVIHACDGNIIATDRIIELAYDEKYLSIRHMKVYQFFVDIANKEMNITVLSED